MRDDELLEAFRRRGDREALGTLFQRHAQPLYNLVLSIVRSSDRAEDAVQQAFLKVMTSDSTPSGEKFRAWIYRIAYHEALQAVRSEQRRDRREIAAHVAGTFPSPEEGLMHEESRAQLQRAVEALEPDLRIPLELRMRHELSFEEIADVLDAPKGTVARKVHEAKEKLTKQLATIAGAFVPAEAEFRKALPMKPVSSSLLEKIDRLKAPTPVPTIGSGVAKPLIVAAILIPLIFGVIALRYFFAGGRPTTAAVANPRSSSSSTLVSQPGAASKNPEARTPADPPAIPNAPPPASTEAVFHVVFAKPEVRLSPQFRPSMNLETVDSTGFKPSPAQEVRSLAAGEFMVRVPCTYRTLFEIEGHPDAPAGAQVTIQSLGWAVGGPGDVVEVRIEFTSPHDWEHTATPEKALLAELARSRSFGAIRGTLPAGGSVSLAGAGKADLNRFMRGGARDGTYRHGAEFVMIPVKAGKQTLTIRSASASATQEIELQAGEIKDLGALRLPAGNEVLAGLVTDENGAAVAAAKVILVEGDPFKDPSGRMVETQTDALGRFRFSGLDPNFREPRVTVMPAYHVVRRDVAARIGQTDLEIKLPRQARIYLAGFEDDSEAVGICLQAMKGPDVSGSTQSWKSDRPNARMLYTVNLEAIAEGTKVRFRRMGKIGQTDLVGEWFELKDEVVVQLRLEPEK